MTIRRLFLILLAAPMLFTASAMASTVTSEAPAPSGIAGRTSVISLAQAGVTRSYRLFVPSVLPAGPRPLVLSLHGLTMTSALQESGGGLDKTAAKGGVLVAYPDGLNSSWNAGTCCGAATAAKVDDVGFLSAVIADVAARHPVDKLRVAVSGFSNGGMMAYRFACERSDLVETIAVVAGAYVAPACTLTRPLSLLHLHGLLDATVPFVGGLVPSLSTKAFRPVLGPVGAIANLDGCSSLSTQPYAGSPLVTQTQAVGCPAGVQVTVLASSTLAHAWPTGSTAVAQYGFDVPTVVWGFLANQWATRGAPVQM